ncbi:TIR domain-containing protein [Amycolatopsis mongoliensis]|uniref:TIR domain-containing protein n=1 Tax=Amycolatopsis mongoliensis TaxID=715475 RepID=A0A9Y2JWW5_9PSEU|nr:SEFIR domain-containing protein [Amycolatopsis sp. 4-36]WIY05121.1 TIR domain-containing protein [Amycolatopsis sp. 4-36]
MTREQQETTTPGAGKPPRVFVTYSHDDERHRDLVREFATFLRAEVGIDVRLDQWADDGRRDWSLWAVEQLTEADFVLVIASPDYKRRAEGTEVPHLGRGAQFEAAMIRDNITQDLPRATRRILPVVLPGRRVEEIPAFLNAHSTTRYEIEEFTMDGVAELLVAFTGVARFALPEIGTFVGARSRPSSPKAALLTSALRPAACSSDVRMTGAEIDGMHRGDSIVYRPSLFAHEPRAVVEYNLGRRYTGFEAVAGVLDDAADADQSGCFQVFLDGVPQGQVEVRMGRPAWMRHDVVNVLRLKLVAYRPGTTASPLLAGVLAAGGQSNKLPELAWGNPMLFE